MEVYVNDMLVKSPRSTDHINLQEALVVLGRYKMNLTPIKCAFGV